MGTDVLTIADLIATASLDTRLLAGEEGLPREVLWAHSCEMVDPAQWLGPHELLMTVGLCVPTAAEDQVSFVARLDDAGLAGMMIGDHDPAPPLSDEMFREADRRGFPILLAGEHTPYAVVARHVAAANTSSQTLQVLKLSKLYHLAAYADDDADTLVSDLGALLGVGIKVLDSVAGLTVFASSLPNGSDHPESTRTYPLRGHHAAQLVLTEHEGEELDSFLLVHLMKVLEVAVDRRLTKADHRAQVAARLMLTLLNGSTPEEMGPFVSPHLPSEGFQLVAFPAADGAAVARAVASHGLPVVVGAGRMHHLALVPSDAMGEFRALVRTVITHAGVSSVFTDYVDTRIAAVEAGKVLAAAQHSDRSWTEFEGSTVSVLTRSRREAEEIVRGVLGPLGNETAKADALRETLFAYLRNDRKWKETAEELGIHRQTLSYRLTRVHEETGLNLAKSSDLSAAWVAYQAWEATRH
jgi:purine catabolism regulator